MPRNATGVYSLPNPPVMVGTVIDAVDENDTRDDMALEFTNSLDRNGRGSMLAALKAYDGTVANPGVTFGNDTDNGIYRSAANTWHLVAQGAAVATISPSAFGVAGAATFSSTLTSITAANTLGELRYNTITPTQLSANTDDWAPTGLSTASHIRVSADAARNLTGITGGAAGRRLVLNNIGSFPITLVDDATSTAANRFDLPGDYVLLSGRSCALIYDATLSRWRLIGEWVSTYFQGMMDEANLAGFLTAAGFSGDMQAFLATANDAAARVALDVPSNTEAVLDAIFDAKGDILVATAADTPARKAAGADGYVLSPSSGGTDGLVYSPMPFRSVQNVSLPAGAFSNAGGALTIALKTQDGGDPAHDDPVFAAFPSTAVDGGATVHLKVTGALGMVISAGSTLGFADGVAGGMYHYLINNAGTVEYAVSGKFFGYAGIASTTAEGGAGAADSNSTMYSTTARANVAFVCIGRTKHTDVTAGTWATDPSEAQLAPFAGKRPTRTVVTATGAGTYNRPWEATHFEVETQGGGGGGGGSDMAAGGSVGASGGGGGGGFSKKLLMADALTYAESYVVGIAGTAGNAAGGNGGGGGTTSFGAGPHLQGAGGSGGTGTTTTTIAGAGVGGAGSSGDINASGGDGCRGSISADGNPSTGGNGGSSHYGGGGPGGAQNGAGQSAGGAGNVYGGGGGGATSDTTTGVAGGAGAQGILIITEFYP